MLVETLYAHKVFGLIFRAIVFFERSIVLFVLALQFRGFDVEDCGSDGFL